MMWWGDGLNWGWMTFGGLMMLIFWGGLIALVFLAIRGFSGSSRSVSEADPSAPTGKKALEVLKERYARGAISKAEYEEIRSDLMA